MEKPFDVKTQVPFDGDEQALPIHVQADGGREMPIADDFIPSPAQAKRKVGRKEVEAPPARVILENAEFRTNAEQKSIEKERNTRILELAKQIYEDKKREVDRWERAAKLVNSATDQQKADPTPDLAQAMVVYERGRPMTKKRAMERAKKEVYETDRPPELLQEG